MASDGADAARLSTRRSRGRTCGPAARPRRSCAAAGRAGTCRRRGPSCSTSMIARHVSRPIRSASVSGPIGWFMPSFITVSIDVAVAHALHQAVDRLVDHRHQDPVGDEAGVVVRLGDRLAHPLCGGRRTLGRRLVAGLEAADHLDQRHQRHRVHEVHADHAAAGRVVTAASRVIGIELVLEARIAPSAGRLVELARRCVSLRSTFSVAASISEVGVGRLGGGADPADGGVGVACSTWPFSTSFVSERLDAGQRPAPAGAGATSTRVTS